MDLTYPAEAEEFRTEIRAWLEENLPKDYDPDEYFSTPDVEKRVEVALAWQKKLPLPTRMWIRLWKQSPRRELRQRSPD